MNSMPNTHTGNPDDVLAARADERLRGAVDLVPEGSGLLGDRCHGYTVLRA